jgi:hypothetical protein
MYFVTDDLMGHPVLYIDEGEVINHSPVFYRTRGKKSPTGELYITRPGKLQDGTNVTFHMRINLRISRDVLYPRIDNLEPQSGRILNCFLGARREPIPRWYGQTCCRTLRNGELAILKQKWDQGMISNLIKQHIMESRMRNIHTIVCYQLRKLGDPKTGKTRLASVLRHLTAYTIGRELTLKQPSIGRPGHRPVRLVAADDEYCECCQHLLINDIAGHDAQLPGMMLPYGFEVLDDELESYLPANLNAHTMFISFDPMGNTFEPAFKICQDFFGAHKPPAAFLCPEILSDGMSAPTPQDYANGTAHIDSSRQLFAWINGRKNDQVLSLDDWGEPNDDLQGLTYIKNGRTIVPKLYYEGE